ncbi:hypothetical protein [Rossellomorea arthrocnemi]|jgi:hypothetical protein|uniref:hypothetical protein n=1 Tax=Rossellomorea arthrocnemi TaxID=2769542 RepID=UPI0019194E8C|nr:hypothetical protein [Rossellomorea arthrocnemi]
MIYLFSLLALILLLPILYFIPIGITNKGKCLIAGVSFCLTLLGIVASTLYPVWVIGLMLLALLGVFSYLMEQRFAGLMVVAAVPAPDVKEEQRHVRHNPEDIKAEIHNDESLDEITEVKAEEEMVLVEDVIKRLEADDDADIKDGEGTPDSIPEIESLQASDEITVEHVLTVSETESLQAQEDESEWFIENTNEKNEVPDTAEEKNELVEGDLSEIESMINNPEEIAEMKTEEPGVFMDIMEEMIEDSDDPDSQHQKEEGVQAEGKVNLEDAPEAKEETIFENNETFLTEDDAYVDELPKSTRIMREVMKTMMEQISLSRSLLTSDQMENMIKHYLHPSLHDQDYYTFARILMDHYMATEQYEDLVTFIKGIEERFKEYPYITMDIEQTKEIATRNDTKLNR